MEDKNDMRGLSYFDMQTYGEDATIGDIFSDGFSLILFEDVCKDDEGITTYMMACKNEADATIGNLAGKQTKELIAKKWLQRDLEKMFISAGNVAERITETEDYADPRGHHPIMYFQSYLHGAAFIYRLVKLRNMKNADLIIKKAVDQCRKMHKTLEHIEHAGGYYIKGNMLTGFIKGADMALYFHTKPQEAMHMMKMDTAHKKEWLEAFSQEQVDGHIKDAESFEKKINAINDKYKESREAEEKRANAFYSMFRKMLAPCQEPECEQIELDSNFLNIYNSPEYNRIHKGIGLKPLNIDRMGNQLRRNGNVDIIFYVEPEDIAKAEKRIPATAAMMLDILMSEYTKTGFNKEMIAIPLKEYMRIRGIKDAKTAREQINNDINALTRMEIKCESPIHGPLLVSPYGGTRSANKNYIKNSVIIFKFNSDWKNLFPYKQLLQIPSITYKINPHYNPHSFYFMKKIAEHKRMNAGSGNENIMSVKSLTEASPTFPTYDDLGSKKHVSQRIIDPFERDLDVLSEAVTWEYTDGQPNNYEQFINNKVKIIWENRPDYQTVIQGKIKREKAKARAKNKAAGGAKR